MRIVIGATGTIGRAVADALSAKHEVVGVSRDSVNVVSPPWITEAFVKLGRPADDGLPASCIGRSRVSGSQTSRWHWRPSRRSGRSRIPASGRCVRRDGWDDRP